MQVSAFAARLLNDANHFSYVNVEISARTCNRLNVETRKQSSRRPLHSATLHELCTFVLFGNDTDWIFANASSTIRNVDKLVYANAASSDCWNGICGLCKI